MYQSGYFPSVLIPVLSDMYGVPEDQILLSYGSEELLRTAFDSLDPRRDLVLTHKYHYSYYQKYLDFKHVRLTYFDMHVRHRSFLFDIDDCIAQLERIVPAILLLTSPNNPTGNSIGPADIVRIMDHVRPDTLVIIDQAYIEFELGVGTAGYADLLSRYPNLMMLRSFSKLYALAGLRIAYALCGVAVKEMLRYQNRYLGMSRLIEEVSIAALKSRAYYEGVRADIINHREQFLLATSKLRRFTVYDSQASFVLAKIDPMVRQAFNAALDAEPVIIGKYVDVNMYRISLGWQKDSERLISIMNILD